MFISKVSEILPILVPNHLSKNEGPKLKQLYNIDSKHHDDWGATLLKVASINFLCDVCPM